MSNARSPVIRAIAANRELVSLLTRHGQLQFEAAVLAMAWDSLTADERAFWTRLHNLDGQERVSKAELARRNGLRPNQVFTINTQITKKLIEHMWPSGFASLKDAAITNILARAGVYRPRDLTTLALNDLILETGASSIGRQRFDKLNAWWIDHRYGDLLDLLSPDARVKLGYDKR